MNHKMAFKLYWDYFIIHCDLLIFGHWVSRNYRPTEKLQNEFSLLLIFSDGAGCFEKKILNTKDNTENYENGNIEVENYEVIVTPSEEILAGHRDATSETYTKAMTM